MKRNVSAVLKRVFVLILSVLSAFSLLSCGGDAAGEETGTDGAVTVLLSEKDGQETGGEPENTGAEPQTETGTDQAAGDGTVNPESGKKGFLVAYFSATGNTASVARYAADAAGADIYEIKPEVPYTAEDLKYYTGCRADREQNDPSARPGIAGEIPDTRAYSVLFLGYPIWHGRAPRIICTFLEGADLTGVTVVPFCTSGSSGIGSSDTELHPLAPGALWIKGVRFAAGTDRKTVGEWISGLDLPGTAGKAEDAKLNVTAKGKTFHAYLSDIVAAEAFAKLLPLTLDMSELNGNEKYAYLGGTLPSNAERPGRIEAGDVMLYGTDCVVIFYESFDTPYSYTRIGRISDPEGLKEALGKGSVSVRFESGADSPAAAGAFDLEKGTVLLNSGYTMPVLGLGTYSLDRETCIRSVKALLENGGRLIDTAYMYGNEEAVGEGVRLAMAEYGIPREEIFIITKIYPTQFGDPEAAIEAALEKLNVGYIDMMLLHHPGNGDVEAYHAMEKYAAEGKIHSLGLSNWYVEELTDFLPRVSVTPALVQNEIHPYYQEKDVVPFIQEKGIVVQCWYPLGGRGHTAELLGDPVITEISVAHGVSPAQVILRWDLQRGIVVIPGSGNPEHIRENLNLFGFELTDAEMERINALDRSEKHDWY